ncbi:MAG: TlpA family protein disulfide reductase [Myxococcaceae bacterium]|nr:TlpA family protein disulfide reductase [Myxococcaceae bacterium]
MGLIQNLREQYKTRRAFRWAVDLSAVLLFIAVVGLWQTREHVRGVAPPAVTLPTLDGRSISLNALGGKPTVLAFWAPWCGVCKASSDNLSRVAKLAGARAHVLSVALEYESLASVQKYVSDGAVDYPVLLGDSALGQQLHVTSFPTVYFVGSDGRISGSAVGYTTTLGLLWHLLWS